MSAHIEAECHADLLFIHCQTGAMQLDTFATGVTPLAWSACVWSVLHEAVEFSAQGQ